ncbi:ankyrin repeat domain-containing protein [Burkholderia vietnamiensis]|uniref:ankyrin repeat domain-containing protein n=1 Tax=Burkholderia vietnamiensis TaxID=60552 RepID=UPI001CF409AB|nr:ankyrin repeat domain-containing protein [Burkholderia vietnamiensis]MCA8448971.1 ankyrin repeat domain-containing protein [Burkholderia vietnamiensis]
MTPHTFLHAIQRNDIEAVEQALDNGMDPNMVVEAGEVSALHAAVKAMNIEVVRSLIAHGANVNAIDEQARTPLHHAVSGGAAITRLLLEAGANPNVRSIEQYSPLHLALLADRPDLETIQALVEAGADVNEFRGPRSLIESATRQFASQDSADGEYDDRRTADDFSALAQAVKMLLKHGAEPGGMALQNAFFQGRMDVVEALVGAGAEVNNRGDLVHWAINSKRSEHAVYLIRQGAEVNEKDHGLESSILVCAVSAGMDDVVEAAIDAGADLNAMDRNGWTPVLQAVADGRVAILNRLLDAGALLKPFTGTNDTLHVAAENAKDPAMIGFLVGQGLDVNEPLNAPGQWHDGMTPLHCAAEVGNDAMLQALLDAGADHRLTMTDGRTALDVAKEGPGRVVLEGLALRDLAEQALAAAAEPVQPRGRARL